MDLILKFLTPETFAMGVAVYLLVKHEGALQGVKKCLEVTAKDMKDSLDRNTTVLALVLDRVAKENNGACRDAMQDLIKDKKEAA